MHPVTKRSILYVRNFVQQLKPIITIINTCNEIQFAMSLLKNFVIMHRKSTDFFNLLTFYCISIYYEIREDEKHEIFITSQFCTNY